MRDWLALPLSPSSPSSIKTSSDEDDCTYDIVNRRSTTTTEDDEEDEEQELSSWVTLLAVFGVVRHTSRSMQAKRKNRLRSTSETTSSPDVLTEEEEVYTAESFDEETVEDVEAAAAVKEEVALAEEDAFIPQVASTEALSTECVSTKQEDTGSAKEPEQQRSEEVSDDEYEQDISMKRSLSASSMASSSDSDNSTPACSQIMRPSKFFDEMALDTTLTSVQICWNHGGKMVQVTGEFNNWSVPVDMVKELQCHVVSIPMDPSKDTEFKFIVDGEWRYAIDLPHRADGRGNVNNVICKQV